MIEGTLITESLRVGTNLEDLTLTVREISRYRAQGTTPDRKLTIFAGVCGGSTPCSERARHDLRR